MNDLGGAGATRAIARALPELIDGVRPEGRNHLIVSWGDAYMQFARNEGDVSMLTEAVSNLYLAPRQAAIRYGGRDLARLGFEGPDVAVTPGPCRGAPTAIEMAERRTERVTQLLSLLRRQQTREARRARGTSG